MDEILIPVDYKNGHIIKDDEIHDIIKKFQIHVRYLVYLIVVIVEQF